jgi:hypothetical protein
MVQTMHRKLSIRRTIEVGDKVPPSIVGISVDVGNEFGQFGHGKC